MDYTALISVWPTLTGTTVDEKLAQINAMTNPGPPRLVPIPAVMDYLRSNNLWLAIKISAAKFAAGDTTGSVGAAAAVDFNEDMRMETIDMDLPIVGSMLSDLVAKNLLTQDQADAIHGLKSTTVSWAKASGYGERITGQMLVEAGLQPPP